MGQSLAQLYVHITFRVKKANYTPIRSSERQQLSAYIGSILKDNVCIPIKINGVEDHVHVLCLLSKNITIAKMIEEIKRHSSRWIKTLDSYYRQFSWQAGYAAFSVSPSVVDRTIMYIENQETHHEKKSFKDEVISFLKEYAVEYDTGFLLED